MKRFVIAAFAVVLAVIMCVSLIACDNKLTELNPGQDEVYTIGWTPNPPICIVDEMDVNKVVGGFDTDLAEAVAKEMGVTFRLKKIEWSNKDNEMSSKMIDIIWNGMTVTPERAETYTLSKNYLKNNQVAVIRVADKDKFNSIEKLATAKRFVAESGSAGEDAYKDNFSGDKLSLLESQAMALTEIKANTADVALVDRTMAEYYCKNNADCMVAAGADNEPILLNDEEFYAIAVRKAETELMDRINAALVKLYANGTYAEILEKYGLTNLACEIK